MRRFMAQPPLERRVRGSLRHGDNDKMVSAYSKAGAGWDVPNTLQPDRDSALALLERNAMGMGIRKQTMGLFVAQRRWGDANRLMAWIGCAL